MKDYHFQVDLKGIIRLLSDNIYSSESVFLRELLQNAVDAIQARKKIEPGFRDGAVYVTYTKQKDGAALTFRDNGIGLTQEELHMFLSVIGQSSKSGEVRGSFIGQFGIGLLSCFLVTNEIQVFTRSVHEETAYKWVGRSEGTYKVSKAPAMDTPGTLIRLSLNASAAKNYSPSRITEYLSEYAFLVKTPLYFDSGFEPKCLNDNFIPWRQGMSTSGEILEFGELLFQERFFDAIPVGGDGLQGYIFIRAAASSAGTVSSHKIYLKDMFVTNDGKGLVPKWAFFTRCFLNADSLVPTASRESFQQNNGLLKAKAQIERRIIDYLTDLSQYNIDKLKAFTSLHNAAIKSLAVDSERVFKLFFPFFVFITTKGRLTGAQILNAARKMPVRYCYDLEDYQRAAPFVAHTRSLLINGGYIYDSTLLSQLGKYFKEAPVKPFEESTLGQLFDKASGAQEEKLSFFMEQAGEALKEFRCRPVLRRFEPEELSGLFVPGENSFLSGELADGEAMDENGFSFLDGFAETDGFFDGFGGTAQDSLYLNCSNPLICRLQTIGDPSVLWALSRVLYVQALLSGRYPVGEKQLAAMNEGLTVLLAFGAGETEL